MTLYFFDGGHHRIPAANLTSTGRWTSASLHSGGAGQYSATGGRRGNACFQISATGGLSKNVSPGSTVAVGFAMQNAGLGSANQAFLRIVDADLVTLHMAVQVSTSGALSVLRNTTTLASTAVGTVPDDGQWHWYEFICTIHDTTGSYTLKMDGATVLTASNVDTRNGASTNVGSVNIRAHHSSGGVISTLEDIYIADTLLGEIRVEQLVPTGNGNYSQLTGSDGNSTDNYRLVDEIPPSMTDYNGHATVGNKDTYTMGDLATASGSIFGVNVATMVTKSDAGAKSGRRVLRSSGTDNAGADLTVPTTPTVAHVSELLTSSPFTAAAWTVSEINGLEAGFEVRS